jgi:hypothetical protein
MFKLKQDDYILSFLSISCGIVFCYYIVLELKAFHGSVLQAFSLAPFFSNQMKDALSRIRESTRSLCDAIVGLSRMKVLFVCLSYVFQFNTLFKNLQNYWHLS